MAYIAPNSDVKLIYGIPWNNTYSDSVWFPNETVQYNVITNTTKYTFSNQSYQRAGRGRIKLNVLCDNLYDCNYMCFRNTSYGTKWFYAFITDVEYINNDTTLVSYQIDVIQTWMFDYDLLPCFIERQHTETDNVGDNLIEEQLETGEYVCYGSGTDSILRNPSNYSIVIVATFQGVYDMTTNEWTFADKPGGYYDNTFSGLFFNRCDSLAEALTFIQQATEQTLSENIFQIFMYPSVLVPTFFNNQTQPETATPPNNGVGVLSITKPQVDIENALPGFQPFEGYGNDGTTIRNNKLYTYPYVQLFITDGEKQQETFRYEFFNRQNGSPDSNPCTFNLCGEVSVNPTVGLCAENYLGMSASLKTSKLEPYNTLYMSNFPVCAYNVDTFKAFIAQTYGPGFAEMTPNRTIKNRRLASSTADVSSLNANLSSFAGDVLDFATAGYTGAHEPGAPRGKHQKAQQKAGIDQAGMLIDKAEQTFNSVHEISNKYLEGLSARGNPSNTSTFNFGAKCWHYYKMSITKQFAKIIDDYFNMYGYAIHECKTPNIHARINWTYIKTVGCKIDGYIPFDHESLITSIYDKGITFWTGIPQFGRYDYPNGLLT